MRFPFGIPMVAEANSSTPLSATLLPRPIARMGQAALIPIIETTC